MNTTPESLKFSPELANIAKKLVLVSQTIQHPGRSEYVKIGDFNYSTRDDIFEVARIALAKSGVAWVPSMRRVAITDTGASTKSGKAQMRSHARVEILYIDQDSGEWVKQTWDGDSIAHDDKGIQGAGTQAVRFALTDMFMLLDGFDMGAPVDSVANNHQVTREKAPPEDAAVALVQRLYDLEFSEDQIVQFGQFIANAEGVPSIKEVAPARMRLWFDRLSAKSDEDARQSVMDAVTSLNAA